MNFSLWLYNGGMTTTHLPRSFEYLVDNDDVILRVGDGWAEFARQNGTSNLDPGMVVGRNLLSFIAGEPARNFYEQLMYDVRVNQSSYSFAGRCDSPQVKRFTHLQITPGDSSISFFSHIDHEFPYPEHVPFLERPMQCIGDSIVTMCTLCKKIELIGECRWLPLEQAVQEHPVLSNNERPQVVQTVCPHCAQLVCLGHSFVKFPENLKKGALLPMVLVLRKMADYWAFYLGDEGLMPNGHFFVQAPYRWESQNDPVDYVLGLVEGICRRYEIRLSRMIILAYEDVGEVVWKVADQSRVQTEVLLVNPTHDVPPPISSEAGRFVVASEPGVITPEWLRSLDTSVPLQHFCISYSEARSLNSLLSNTVVLQGLGLSAFDEFASS